MMHYRPEIDGLRALAVLPVMLFHAGFQTFQGGFVGVDVFFVISGYLITSIILAELEAGRFSIVRFYERRARRILPALFLVMFVCLPFAWLWLLPPSMKSFSQSVAAVSMFASNILFWRTSGYFDSAAELKPLLHTWSLAVEEQFYVLFPICLMLAWRLGKHWTLGLFGVAFVTSLGLAQHSSIAEPAAAFYLLPTRAWELLTGAFVAIYMAKPGCRSSSTGLQTAGGLLGVSLILMAIFAFDKETPFPGFYALVPTCGTAIILLCATQSDVVGKFLGNRLLVGIGLISYSAYLWHQPMLAFAKHQTSGEPGKALLGCALLVSGMLAYFSWRYVEVPFRIKGTVSRPTLFISSVFGSALFLAFGLLGHFSNGYQWRYGQDQTSFLDHFDNRFPDWNYARRENWYENFRIECDMYDIPRHWAGDETTLKREIATDCFTRDHKQWPNAIMIWGDSHAQHFYAGLKQVLPSSWQILQVASSGCGPSVEFDADSEDYCDNSNQLALQTIVEGKPDVVLVGQEKNHDVVAMNKISATLRRHGIKKVIFVGPSPHWKDGGLPAIVAFRLWDNIPPYAKVGVDQDILLQDKSIKEQFITSQDVKYISLIDYLCGPKGCRVYFGDDVREGITTFDYGHLTPIASFHFARDVLGKEILKSATTPAEPNDG